MPSFKETYEAIKADITKGEKNFNVECKMLEDGMQVECTMGAKPFKLLIDAPPGLDGTNEGPSPLLVILSSVGACIAGAVGIGLYKNIEEGAQTIKIKSEVKTSDIHRTNYRRNYSAFRESYTKLTDIFTLLS